MVRAIACLSVVFTHVFTNFKISTEYIWSYPELDTILRYLTMFATPVFILISILLLSLNYKEKLPRNFFLKRFKYILLPYIIIGLITTFVATSKSGAPFWESAWRIIGLGNWHGFFILVIFQFYLLYFLFDKVLRKLDPWLMITLSLAVSYGHLYSFEMNPEYREFMLNDYPLSYRTNILAWLFYFTAGYYIGLYYKQITDFLSNKLFFIFLATVGSYTYIYYNITENSYTFVSSDRYDMFFYTISMFFLLLMLFRKLKKPIASLEIISSFSFFIYLSHMLFLGDLSSTVQIFGDNVLLYNLILVLFTTGFSIGIGILLYLNPLTRLMTGKNNWLDTILHPKFTQKN